MSQEYSQKIAGELKIALWQAAAVAELMNHNRDKTMILLGEPIGTLSAERFVPITLALGARNAAAVDLNPSDRNQPAPAGNEPFFE